MKVLVVLKDVPMHEGSAPGKTAVGLLRGLLEHGLDVRAIAARQHFTPPGEPPPGLPIEVVEVAPERVGRLEHIRRPRGELGRGRFAERVREAAREADILHLEEIDTLWAGEGVSPPAVLHVHYLVYRDRPLAGPWSREGRELLELVLAERAARRRFRQLVASSPVVAAELRRRAPRAEVTVAPLSLDPEYYVHAPLGEAVAGFIGTASWPPTAAAATRLVRDVWPLVRRAAPAARLRIAGRGMERLVAGAEGVEVVGTVPSARNFFAGLSLLLFPLTRGSGMKVKTLEALASSVPVVTTAPGAEGIEASDGVVVADGDESLAAAAAALLADEDERRERGDAARVTFERSYAPGIATAPLVTVYRRIAALR